MSDTIDPRFIDKRTAERYVRAGNLDEKAWEKHLKSLPDLADKAATVEANLSDLDEDTEEDDDE
jgi:hypothetical protein